MSTNLDTFCFIDNSKSSNKCEDKNYAMSYDNKVDYYSSPSSMNLIPESVASQSTNIGSTSLNTSLYNNNTQPYAHVGHDVGNNTTFTRK